MYIFNTTHIHLHDLGKTVRGCPFSFFPVQGCFSFIFDKTRLLFVALVFVTAPTQAQQAARIFCPCLDIFGLSFVSFVMILCLGVGCGCCSNEAYQRKPLWERDVLVQVLTMYSLETTTGHWSSSLTNFNKSHPSTFNFSGKQYCYYLGKRAQFLVVFKFGFIEGIQLKVAESVCYVED